MNAPLETSVQPPRKTKDDVAQDLARNFRKRAMRVRKTRDLIFPLIDLHSPIENQYWQSYYCCHELKQEGVYLNTKYCNKRWCFQCNAIRAAKMIEGYKPVIEKWPGAQFVTLTRPNVPGEKLLEEVDDLVHTFELCRRHLREQRKISLKGIRKLEVTYNNRTKTFHPHFHLIVEDLRQAQLIVGEWLFYNDNAVPEAQEYHRVEGDEPYIELFKYVTKEMVKKNTPFQALDLVFQSIVGKRIYQSFGIKKHVPEDVAELERQAVGSLEPVTYRVWEFNPKKEDWFDCYGCSLIDTINPVHRFCSTSYFHNTS